MEGSAARLARSVERKALILVVVGSSPTVGVLLCVGFAVAAICVDASVVVLVWFAC